MDGWKLGRARPMGAQYPNFANSAIVARAEIRRGYPAVGFRQ